MQIYFVVFAVSGQINKQKYGKTINMLWSGNKVFVKYQVQGGFNPQSIPLCLRPCFGPRVPWVPHFYGHLQHKLSVCNNLNICFLTYFILSCP